LIRHRTSTGVDGRGGQAEPVGELRVERRRRDPGHRHEPELVDVAGGEAGGGEGRPDRRLAELGPHPDEGVVGLPERVERRVLREGQGEVTAAHLGIDVKKSVNPLMWTGSILTSAVVAVSGPIGFVGLIVPHSLRLLVGSDNRLLAVLSAIYGGVFLVACDFLGWRGMELLQQAGVPLAQTTEIPVGIVTALLGGPFFLYLLLRSNATRG
jgi:hypothetical protein